MQNQTLSAQEALAKLKEGNQHYLAAETNPGDVSPKIRQYTCDNGQSPYAIVVTCSDSRVIPEGIFSAGIGELFVIRVAGNVMDKHQLGSIEYAAEHLGSRLLVILGHTHCGAVGAALSGDPGGFIQYITDEIKNRGGKGCAEGMPPECGKGSVHCKGKPEGAGGGRRTYRMRRNL